jgi:hypothetical protein
MRQPSDPSEPPPPALPTRSKYLVLTCDTEALIKEAPADHVDRLIWGKFPDSPYPAGIGLMMDIADEYGAKISFFYDVLERLRYGEEIDEAARYILGRGHDLQLHLHIEFLPPEFWHSRGCQPVTWAMNLFDHRSAQYIVEYGVSLFEAMAGRRPLAYRAGAFRYNSNILKALAEFGVRLSFQYNPATIYKPSYPYGFDAGVLPVFQWSNGLIEVPCGVNENPNPRRGNPRYAGFEFQHLTDLDHCHRMMETFFQNGPEFQVFVLVLHSWSLLRRNEAGIFTWQGDHGVNLFRQILAHLPPDVEVVSATELYAKIEEGLVTPQFEMPLCVAGTDGIPLYPLPGQSQPTLAPRAQSAAPEVGSGLKSSELGRGLRSAW